MVSTESGHKAIENIEIGDKVWAYDEETGEQQLKEVVTLFRNETSDWVHVYINDEEKLTCTKEHPFFIPDLKQWVNACDLTMGMNVLLSTYNDVLPLDDSIDKNESSRYNYNTTAITKIEVEVLETPETTYNFEVRDFHTYYVGEASVLVHNTCADIVDDSFDVLEFDQKAINIAKEGNPTFQTFKNRLFAEQQRLHGTFDEVVRGINPSIGGKQVILHHPLGRAGANLYNVVGVTQSQHLAIHAITGYKNAMWSAVTYNLGGGIF